MPPDPLAHASLPTRQASAGRYRAALRCAILRRERRPVFTLLDRWTWLFPRILLAVLSSLAAMVGAAVAPAAPSPGPITLPAPCIAPAETPEPVLVMISKSGILVGDPPTLVVPLPSREQLVLSGVEAKYKRSGPNDMLVVPLERALEQARDASMARFRTGGDDRPVEAVLIADATTPYRLLIEVLFTLGQSNVGKYHLMVLSRKK